tara:strand:+ start:119 stop:586 length:468 start_codon:yes stop_codon:yes gene_type:complete
MTTIENYENYKIFENGNVINTKSGRIKKSCITNDGYLRISLCKNGKCKHYLIHRLLGLAYIPNPENKECIDHINRDRLDNRLENLRWATRLENSHNTGLRFDNTSGEKNIYKIKQNNSWIFQKLLNKKIFYKLFKKKEDAIQFKNKFYLENNIVE